MAIESMNPNYLGTEEEEIYKENILDHFKNPRNFGELKICEICHSELNPTCGDMIKIFVKLKDGNIKEAKFKGNGCAISMASASMLTEKIKGKKLDEVKKMNDDEINKMLGVRLGPVRAKCGMLSLKTLLRGIKIMEDENGQDSRISNGVT